MRALDFSSWQTLLSTLLGLSVITLIGVVIRLTIQQSIQHRRERANRQINERLRTLIAAYKTLGGSFTGNLSVDPTHFADLRRRADAPGQMPVGDGISLPLDARPSAERSRRVRDAVEAALSDIILLGTENQVRLAAAVATELAAGRPVHTDALVISLRTFIREVLDLAAVPADLRIPRQGPARPPTTRKKGEDGAKEAAKADSGGGGGGGAGAGAGTNFGSAETDAADEEHGHQ